MWQRFQGIQKLFFVSTKHLYSIYYQQEAEKREPPYCPIINEQVRSGNISEQKSVTLDSIPQNHDSHIWIFMEVQNNVLCHFLRFAIRIYWILHHRVRGYSSKWQIAMSSLELYCKAKIRNSVIISQQRPSWTFTCGVTSVIGIFSGSPYVAHVLEYIKACTPCAAIASNKIRVFDVILW